MMDEKDVGKFFTTDGRDIWQMMCYLLRQEGSMVPGSFLTFSISDDEPEKIIPLTPTAQKYHDEVFIPKVQKSLRAYEMWHLHPATKVIEEGYFCPRCGKRLPWDALSRTEWTCFNGLIDNRGISY